MGTLEGKWSAAADGGDVAGILSRLRDNPRFNVNWTDASLWTALHNASQYGHVEVVKVLLAHPDINANLKNWRGQTSFSKGCEYARVSVVCGLLKDPRVNITLEDNAGRSPLWWASYNGQLEVVEWLITSGRDLGDANGKGK